MNYPQQPGLAAERTVIRALMTAHPDLPVVVIARTVIAAHHELADLLDQPPDTERLRARAKHLLTTGTG